MPRTRATSRERSSAATTDWPISPVGPVTATVSVGDGPARAAIGALYRTAALPTLEGVPAALASTSFGYVLSRAPVRRSFSALAPGLGVASLAFGVWYALGAVAVVPYVF